LNAGLLVIEMTVTASLGFLLFFAAVAAAFFKTFTLL